MRRLVLELVAIVAKLLQLFSRHSDALHAGTCLPYLWRDKISWRCKPGVPTDKPQLCAAPTTAAAHQKGLFRGQL